MAGAAGKLAPRPGVAGEVVSEFADSADILLIVWARESLFLNGDHAAADSDTPAYVAGPGTDRLGGRYNGIRA